jgi:hypothetical protein
MILRTTRKIRAGATGAQVKTVYEIKELDNDFFEED